MTEILRSTIKYDLFKQRFDLKASLLSLSLPQSSAWLFAPPVLELKLSLNEFRIALKNQLVVKLYEHERNCSFCKSGTLNLMRDHAVLCHGQGDMIARQDRIQDRILSACSKAPFVPICVQNSLLADNNSRPGDIFVPVWNGGQPEALNVK